MNGKVGEPGWLKACAIIDALGMTLDEFRALQLGKEPPSYCPADAGQVDLDGYYASMNKEARQTLVDTARLMGGSAEARIEKEGAEHPAAEEAV